MDTTYRIECECKWDSEAKVWYVHSSSLPGLNAEAPTVEAMLDALHERIPELLKLNGPELKGCDEVPLELLWTQQDKIRIAC